MNFIKNKSIICIYSVFIELLIVCHFFIYPFIVFLVNIDLAIPWWTLVCPILTSFYGEIVLVIIYFVFKKWKKCLVTQEVLPKEDILRICLLLSYLILVEIGTLILLCSIDSNILINVLYILFGLETILMISFITYYVSLTKYNHDKVSMIKMFNYKIVIVLIGALLLLGSIGWASYSMTNVHTTGNRVIKEYQEEYGLHLPDEYDCQYRHFEGFTDWSDYSYYLIEDDSYHLSAVDENAIDQVLVSLLENENIPSEYRLSLDSKTIEYYSVNEGPYYFRAIYFVEERILITLLYTM